MIKQNKVKAMNEKKSKDKIENMSITKQLLTSCVCSAIIAGVFSMITSWSSNEIAKEIEIQRFQFELHKETYQELQEALDYFSRVKVYDVKFINNFDYESDNNNLDYAMELKDVSMEEFKAQIRCIMPYLSKEAKTQIENSGIFEYEFDTYKINEANFYTKESVNQEIKKYFYSVNDEIEKFSKVIIKAIEYDIKSKYIPEYEYIL